jgi:hypothetical protein
MVLSGHEKPLGGFSINRRGPQSNRHPDRAFPNIIETNQEDSTMAAPKIKIVIGLAIVSWAVWAISGQSSGFFSPSPTLAAEQTTVSALKVGQKHWIEDQYYFVLNFDKKPQMGTIIVKVQVFSKEGKQDGTMDITGSADMPSMKGAHGTGDRLFKQNNKADYLLPINIVMPGQWEIVINFIKDKKTIYRGSLKFDV